MSVFREVSAVGNKQTKNRHYLVLDQVLGLGGGLDLVKKVFSSRSQTILGKIFGANQLFLWEKLFVLIYFVHDCTW